VEDLPFSDVSYNKYIAEEKLMGSRCRGCGALFTPPRSICPVCFGSAMEWVTMEGKGKLAAFTCIFIAPPSMTAQGYGRNRPYCVGVVELVEGPRVAARIEGVDASNPLSIKVGMAVRAIFPYRTDKGGADSYLTFEPA